MAALVLIDTTRNSGHGCGGLVCVCNIKVDMVFAMVFNSLCLHISKRLVAEMSPKSLADTTNVEW